MHTLQLLLPVSQQFVYKYNICSAHIKSVGFNSIPITGSYILVLLLLPIW